MKTNIYVDFAGTCKDALQYYEKLLGAKIQMMMMFDQTPDPKSVPPGMEEKLLHARIMIGDAAVMASDGPKVEPMRSAYLTLSVESNDEAERMCKELSDGSEVFMPMAETFLRIVSHSFATSSASIG